MKSRRVLFPGDDGVREPCPMCREIEACAECLARIERVAVRAAVATGAQGDLFHGRGE